MRHRDPSTWPLICARPNLPLARDTKSADRISNPGSTSVFVEPEPAKALVVYHVERVWGFYFFWSVNKFLCIRAQALVFFFEIRDCYNRVMLPNKFEQIKQKGSTGLQRSKPWVLTNYTLEPRRKLSFPRAISAFRPQKYIRGEDRTRDLQCVRLAW